MDRPSYCFHGYLIYSRFDSECLIWRYEKEKSGSTKRNYVCRILGYAWRWGALFLLYAAKAGRHSRLKGKIRVKKGLYVIFLKKLGKDLRG